MKNDAAFDVLTEPAPLLSEAAVADILKVNYSVAGEMSMLASERDQNVVVRLRNGDKRLLKIANSAERFEVTDFQTEALLHVERVDPDFPVPRVVRTNDGRTQFEVTGEDRRCHTARLLTWLDGMPLASVAYKPDIAARMGAVLARLGLALQHFEHPASNYALLWDLKQAERLRDLLPDVEDRQLRRLCDDRLARYSDYVAPAMSSLRSQVIFNDLNPSNLLVEDKYAESICGIIDFGDMVRSPLVADIAVGSAYLCRADDKPLLDVAKFVSGFHDVRPLQDSELEVLFDLIMTRHVMTILITHWRASQYPENRRYILRNEPRARRTIETLVDMPANDGTDVLRAACNG